MADWSIKNRACKTLWSTLFVMHQFSTNFDDSGALPMSDLQFFNPLESEDLRKQHVGMIADQLDITFRFGRGAKYEDGFDHTKAITGMTAVLIVAEKKVAELAAIIDTMYKFIGEVKV